MHCLARPFEPAGASAEPASSFQYRWKRKRVPGADAAARVSRDLDDLRPRVPKRGAVRGGRDQQQPLPGPQAPPSTRSPVKGASPFVVRGSRKAGVLQSNSAAPDSGGSFAARNPVKQPV